MTRGGIVTIRIRSAALSAPRAALLMLAKAPVPGQVKTRMCPPVSPVQAAQLAAAAFRDTLDVVLAVPGVTPVVALTGDLAQAIDADALIEQLRATTVLPQRGATLGQRIATSIADAVAAVGPRPVLQIGMDTPQVDAILLSRCLDLLDGDGVDAALGMAADGGWWILGVRRPELADLIADIPTSRPDTGARTMAALRAAGCRVIDLPTLSDVDTWENAVAVAASVPGGRFAAAVAALEVRR
ncbi:MAG: TIGR04282 family arsenosugar biosynthesis glycosyltransferase [Pseudonocardiaceae bacterium]